jgi:hypothetical protein
MVLADEQVSKVARKDCVADTQGLPLSSMGKCRVLSSHLEKLKSSPGGSLVTETQSRLLFLLGPKQMGICKRRARLPL